MKTSLPTIALFTGDPAGIGAELVEKLLRSDAASKANITLIGQHAQIASWEIPNANIKVHEWSGADASGFEISTATAKAGAWMLAALQEGLRLVQSHQASALCFAPLNKSALRLGGMTEEDELRWFAKALAFDGYCGELNVLENLWTARVTSHVALCEVATLLSPEGVARAIRLMVESLKSAGLTQPRVAVCGLNPHNGDQGNYGDEEGRIIAPGMALAAAQGLVTEGPFPADTAFVRATKKDASGKYTYDGVVTMYHDQGQIAMKLMGFERGVTVHGGLPVTITTPAHGTAYDIAGKGLANVGAMQNAFELAVRMVTD